MLAADGPAAEVDEGELGVGGATELPDVGELPFLELLAGDLGAADGVALLGHEAHGDVALCPVAELGGAPAAAVPDLGAAGGAAAHDVVEHLLVVVLLDDVAAAQHLIEQRDGARRVTHKVHARVDAVGAQPRALRGDVDARQPRVVGELARRVRAPRHVAVVEQHVHARRQHRAHRRQLALRHHAERRRPEPVQLPRHPRAQRREVRRRHPQLLRQLVHPLVQRHHQQPPVPRRLQRAVQVGREVAVRVIRHRQDHVRPPIERHALRRVHARLQVGDADVLAQLVRQPRVVEQEQRARENCRVQVGPAQHALQTRSRR